MIFKIVVTLTDGKQLESTREGGRRGLSAGSIAAEIARQGAPEKLGPGRVTCHPVHRIKQVTVSQLTPQEESALRAAAVAKKKKEDDAKHVAALKVQGKEIERKAAEASAKIKTELAATSKPTGPAKADGKAVRGVRTTANAT